MTVNLLISKTLAGSAVADSLAGGGSGVDLGNVINGEYGPIVLKSANTGWQNLFISHDATVDSITNVKTYIAAYSQTYGGAGANAAADLATMKAHGAASGDSANNSDGLSRGLRVEHGADVTGTLGASAFDATRAQVKVYGKSYAAVQSGIDLATGFTVHEDAMVRNVGGTETVAVSPVAGVIGKSGDTAHGDHAHLKLRLYLHQAATSGGIIQWDWIVAYAYTA